MAEVDGVPYTISEALDTANRTNNTIKMIANFGWNIEIPENYTITIDLNGFDVYPEDGGNPFFNYGTLYLNNTSSETSMVGDANTETAIYNTGSLTIAPDTTSGGIEVYGSVINGNDDEHISPEQSITINDGTSVIGKGNIPTLRSLGDSSALIINGGTFSHEGQEALIDFVSDGYLTICGGTFTAADSYPILSSFSRNNQIDIGVTGSEGPTFVGNTDGYDALFIDRMFDSRDNTNSLSFYSGTVTQNGDGVIFEFGIQFNGGEMIRSSAPDSEYPLIHSTAGLRIGTTIEGSSAGPLILCDGEMGFSENGSVKQTGTGYAIECGSFYTSDGTVEAVGDAILSHGHIEINGDSTKPTITSQTGYCFVARYGSFEGGVYNFGSDANVINLDIDPGSYNGISFDGNAVINGTLIGSVSGPLTDAYGMEPLKMIYGFEGTESTGVATIYTYSTDQWTYTETREVLNVTVSSVFTPMYSVTIENGRFLFENLDTAAIVFQDDEEVRTLTLLADVDTASLSIPTHMVLDLNNHSIGSLSTPYGTTFTVNGTGNVSSVTYMGYLRINGGTFQNISGSDTATLEVNGGTFANVPTSAIVPEDMSFVQDNGMWTLQKVLSIEVDGTQYYSYKEAEKNIKNGSTVTLLIDGFKPLTIGNGEDGIRNVTIDLNGHYIDCQNTEGITINKGVVATMRDDNPSRTGTMIMNAGNLTITSGTYSLVINYGLGESNVLTIKGGDFIGTEIDGSTSTSLIIGDPMGASTVRITGGTFHGPVMSWDIYPDDGRAPKVYIGGGTFNNVLIGLSGESFDGPTISLEDAGFMISGGKFIEISEDAIQTGYTLRQSEGMYEVVLSESATTSTVTLDSGYADAEEVIIELQNQTIVSDGSNLVIPTLEDGFQNMTVEVDGKKFTTVVEVSNGVIVNDVDMTIPDGTTTIDNQKLESDPTLSKTVVSNVNSILDELDGDGKEVEIVLKPSETENTNQIIAQSGGTPSISIDININTVVNNETAEKRNIESLLEFIIPIPEEDLGKSFLVYRMHETDEGVTEISALPQLSSRNNVTTEGFLVENGYIHIFAQKFSTYTAVTGAETVEDDDDIIFPPWGWDDNDDYVPPIVPSQTEDSGDDNTTSIVACAAAAVVAALMAAYLIIDRRR